jgi:ABC-type oligopeptide transport system substrate-binding subunit
MKTILRIIIILLVTSVVAGAFSLAVNNTSIASDSAGEGGQPPVMTSTDGQFTQPTERPEGGEGASVTRGLSEVLVTLGKLTGITIIILFLQKVLSLLGSRKLIPTQR